jgi:hypothetical protein
MQLRQIKAIEAAAGSWKDKDHPELRRGAKVDPAGHSGRSACDRT